jgi:serine protease inhibitor
MRQLGWALGLLIGTLRAEGGCREVSSLAQAASVSAGIAVGLDILRIQPSQSNALLSPVVVEGVLIALEEGALGSTKRELLQVLPSNVSAQAFGCMTQEWEMPGTTPKEGAPGLSVRLSGSVWVQEGILLKPDFQRVVRDDLHWHEQAIDFRLDSARGTINSWIARATENKIPELFADRMIDRQTRLVMAATAYFKGKWSLPFDAALTKAGPFRQGDGHDVTAQYMTVEAYFPYADNQKEQVILLPIQGQDQRWALMVVLPREGVTLSWLENLESGDWSQWLASTQPRFVNLTFPRLKIRQRIDLEEALKQLGVTELFSPQADLGNLSDDSELFVGAAVSEAVLEVNEMGLEAAAAAGVAIRTLSYRLPPETISMVVDRPFLLAIVDRLTGALLFVGHCQNPGTS